MPNDIRMTTAMVKLASAFLAEPEADRYGLDLMKDTGLASGTLYPMLARLEQAGWVHSAWEDIDPVAEGRPRRRYYRLTAEGVRSARLELAALRQHLSRVSGVLGEVGRA